jgi:CDP-diglyceride synthetase
MNLNFNSLFFNTFFSLKSFILLKIYLIKINEFVYVLKILSFLSFSLLYCYGAISLYIAYKNKTYGEKEAFKNNIAISITLLTSLSLNYVIVQFLPYSNINFIVFPFDFLMIGFIILFFPLFSLFVIKEKLNLKKRDTLSSFKVKEYEELPLKYDIYRKLTHLVVLMIILFYFTLGFWLQNLFFYIFDSFPPFLSDLFYSIFTIEGDIMIFTQYLVVFLVGISLIGLLTADFVRLLKPELYPLKPVNQLLRKKEQNMRLGPQISMAVGCFSIIILYGLFQPVGPLIICTTVTMTIFGDIASNLIGRVFGKNRITNSNKTYEGLIAGIIIALISGFLILHILRGYYLINIFQYLLFPIVGALVIGFLDYMNFDIDDNLLNPISVSTILLLITIAII